MKKPLTFGQWLKTQTERRDGIGDFARDYVAPGINGKCCGRFQSYKAILRHTLRAHTPCGDALNAFKWAYRVYKKEYKIVARKYKIVVKQPKKDSNLEYKGIYTRELKNPAERQCFDELSKEGWALTKRGWPDFACFKDGEFIAIEVKPSHDKHLKREQYIVMVALSKMGITCYRWTPDTKLTLITSPNKRIEKVLTNSK